MVSQNILQDIKERTDCRHLIERDLGRPHGSPNGKTYAWRCPLHNETKGYSLTAWADGWKCWGACATGGDAIKWLQIYHGLGFEDACHALGAEDKQIGGSKTRRFVRVVHHQLPRKAEPPDSEWQTLAMQIIQQARDCLWSAAGDKALSYLRGRGLQREIIREAQLGYIPGHYTEYKHYRLPSGARFAVPCGIVIPWLIDDAVWGIKVRRAAGALKYIQVAGSRISGQALYWADHLFPHFPALFVEGEFDCLIAWQEAADLVCPVTLGAATNTLNPCWYARLAQCKPILICYDGDKAGHQGADRLAALSNRARRIPLPHGKDVSEFYKGSPMRGVYEWLQRHV